CAASTSPPIPRPPTSPKTWSGAGTTPPSPHEADGCRRHRPPSRGA
ncbi:MAG: hypothetical protein AVDCRST_MAG83-3290, partial [uncultured Arthrobacter sp.]